MREPFERILVRAPNPLGDAVMATPLFRCLRRNWPRARITVVATPAGAETYRGLDSVDRIEVIGRGGADRGPLGLWRAARRLRPERFDLAIVCPNSHSAALHAFLAGARRRLEQKKLALAASAGHRITVATRTPAEELDRFAHALHAVGRSADADAVRALARAP